MQVKKAGHLDLLLAQTFCSYSTGMGREALCL